MANSTARAEWVATQVDDVVQKGLDGFNFDFEDPLDPDSPESHGYTALVKELREALLAALPAAQVSVDVAWSAAGIDGRFYDYTGLAANSDLLFVMAYDEMSQIWDEPCNARPNSNLTYAEEGIMTYQALGIENSKLVLGLPWYGYVYRCIEYFPDNETCLIEEIPFRGCPCSDAAGRQYEYRLLQDLLRERNLTELLLDKTTYARSEGLAGAGMWAANFLDYSDTPEGQMQRDAMWGVMP
ncbi:hypothetical protein HAZT_HAZT007424 [Hyalella azteca]|uniref:GH18 domain-containing protein n=1 Tax=Hyalella azteca TaxID=294128 RepID=A0A6A0GXR9_HYAAZ|nr:hypothetical protein HAZT_HAZT007424 [Hyalella azteca]